MTKKDIINVIHEANPHMLQKDIKKIIQSFFDAVHKGLEEGKRLEFRGFGSFSVRSRKGYHAQNPKTGAHFFIPEKTIPFFRAGKKLKQSAEKNSIASPIPSKKANFFSSLYNQIKNRPH
jgi:integration host factor subunit beta